MTLQKIELPYYANSVEAYSYIRQLGFGFLLDSGRGYSDQIDVYSANPVAIERFSKIDASGFQNKLECLQEQLRQCNVHEHCEEPGPGWYGIWSYTLTEVTEQIVLKQDGDDSSTIPMVWMGFFPTVVVTNHRRKTTRLITLTEYDYHSEPLLECLQSAANDRLKGSRFELRSPFSSNTTITEYQHRFDRVQHYIRAGDCYQVNLAQAFKADYSGDPWHAYCHLRQSISAPMGCYFEAEDWALLSLSPERFISHNQGQVTTKPIKGTRPRSDDPAIDQRNAEALFESSKDRAENLMIVDLLRNDLGRSCEVGSVVVEQLFEIESFTNVHHLVSTITGKLKRELSPLQLLAAAFPGGSITGAPKHRAIEIIDELESESRQFYCGSALYLDVTGRMDSNILIRSLLARNGVIRCWGGGGLVADSTWEQEYQEIQDKVGNLFKILS